MKLNLFKTKHNLIKKNNEGMALVTVIVAIGFIAALVSVLMLTTVVNFKMKNVNERSKDTFYSAEQAINEINIGLQHVVSESMSEAYMDIMANYQTYDVDQKKDLLTTKYYEAIWDKLEKADKGNGFYDVAKLEDMLKPTTKWHTPSGEADGYGAIVVAVAEDGTESKVGQMITYQKSGVVLKNVKVYYKDQMGFVSVIQTDIRIQYPEFDFANTSELPTIPKYAFVADNGAEITATNGLALKGNMYANNIEITSGGSSVLNVYTAPDQVITSKYDFVLNEKVNYLGKDVKRDTDGDPLAVWSAETEDSAVTLRARNAIINSADARFAGKLLLANDLNIKGKNSNIALVGEFTGYGMGANLNDSATNLSWNATASNPDWSSAILINGKNTSLDMSGLNEITLYGHSFIGTGKVGYFNNRNGNMEYSETLTTVLNNNKGSLNETKSYKDLAMGESMAVKTNQMLYLLPPSVIGVDDTGKSKFNKNPLTQDEYQQLVRDIQDAKCSEYSTDVVVSELGTTLEEFAKGNGQLGVQKIWARVNDSEIGSLVYYYISFDDEAIANKYFAARYASSKERFDNYASNYLTSVKWPNTDTMLTYNIAGNVIDKNGDDFTRVPASITTATTSDEHKNKSIKYLKDFKGMCFNLEIKQNEANYASVKFEDTYEAEAKDATKQAANQKVFENLISESNIEKFVTDVTSGVDAYDNVKMVSAGAHEVGVYDVAALSAEEKNSNPTSGTKVAIICDDDVDITIDGSNENVKLVVTKGDVTVKRDFKGLILCDGKIDFEGTNLRIEADPDEVRKILQFGYEDLSGSGDVVTIAYTLQDGTQYIYSASTAGGYTSDLALGGLISYENWKKD